MGAAREWIHQMQRPTRSASVTARLTAARLLPHARLTCGATTRRSGDAVARRSLRDGDAPRCLPAAGRPARHSALARAAVEQGQLPASGGRPALLRRLCWPGRRELCARRSTPRSLSSKRQSPQQWPPAAPSTSTPSGCTTSQVSTAPACEGARRAGGSDHGRSQFVTSARDPPPPPPPHTPAAPQASLLSPALPSPRPWRPTLG